MPLGGPAPAAASLSPGLTLATAGLRLSSVTGSAEILGRPFALASAPCKRNKGLVGQATASFFYRQTRYRYQTCCVGCPDPLVKLAAHVGNPTLIMLGAVGTGGIGLADIVTVA